MDLDAREIIHRDITKKAKNTPGQSLYWIDDSHPREALDLNLRRIEKQGSNAILSQIDMESCQWFIGEYSESRPTIISDQNRSTRDIMHNEHQRDTQSADAHLPLNQNIAQVLIFSVPSRFF